jgi:hypothetical protein
MVRPCHDKRRVVEQNLGPKIILALPAEDASKQEINVARAQVLMLIGNRR